MRIRTVHRQAIVYSNNHRRHVANSLLGRGERTAKREHRGKMQSWGQLSFEAQECHCHEHERTGTKSWRSSVLYCAATPEAGDKKLGTRRGGLSILGPFLSGNGAGNS
eukprot:3426613-Rhodomonas_salina.1